MNLRNPFPTVHNFLRTKNLNNFYSSLKAESPEGNENKAEYVYNPQMIQAEVQKRSRLLLFQFFDLEKVNPLNTVIVVNSG